MPSFCGTFLTLQCNFPIFFLAFARICESIIDFYADEQRADKAELKSEDYAGEVYSAYDILFNNWLKTSKEARVGSCIVIYEYGTSL